MNPPQPPIPPVPPAIRTKQTKKRLPRRLPKRGKPQHARGKRVRRELSAGGVAVCYYRNSWFAALLKTEHKRGEVWVLPKGHVEHADNERIPDAARREVEEEAGLNNLKVRDRLGITKFTFQVEDGIVKKTVHYYLMETEHQELIPQTEEGFIDAAWFPIDRAIDMLEYDTDQDIVSKAKQILLPTAKQTRTRVHV